MAAQTFEVRKRPDGWWVFCDFYLREADKWIQGPFLTKVAAIVAMQGEQWRARESDAEFDRAEAELYAGYE